LGEVAQNLHVISSFSSTAVNTMDTEVLIAATTLLTAEL
jgi:hypothetical protein